MDKKKNRPVDIIIFGSMLLPLLGLQFESMALFFWVGALVIPIIAMLGLGYYYKSARHYWIALLCVLGGLIGFLTVAFLPRFIG